MKKLLLLMLLTAVVPVEAFGSPLDIATKVCKEIKPISPIFVATRNVGKACAEELNENGSQEVRDCFYLYCIIINVLDNLYKIIDPTVPKNLYPCCDPFLALSKNIIEGCIDCLKVQDISRGWRFLTNGHHCELLDIADRQLMSSLKIKVSLKELGKAFAQECNGLLSHSECNQLKEELKAINPVDGFFILTVEECIAHLK